MIILQNLIIAALSEFVHIIGSESENLDNFGYSTYSCTRSSPVSSTCVIVKDTFTGRGDGGEEESDNNFLIKHLGNRVQEKF